MPDNHLRFHSANGKRQVLIIADNLDSFGHLKPILSEKYELVAVDSGPAALSSIIRRRDTLSLVLLDLSNPDARKLDIITALRGDPDLSRLPVIVISPQTEREAQCLRMGRWTSSPSPIRRRTCCWPGWSAPSSCRRTVRSSARRSGTT